MIRTINRAFTQVGQTHLRPDPRNAGNSIDFDLESVQPTLLEQARHLDQNVDLASAILDDVVTGMVGTGTQVEPIPTDVNGAPLPRAADELAEFWRRWWRRPESTRQLSGPDVERLVVRAYLRDGDHFTRNLIGATSGFPFRTGDVPYALELIEAEYCPFDLLDERRNIRMGVELNGWNQPLNFYFHRSHPGDLPFSGSRPQDYLRVPAELVIQIMHTKRWPATRGTSVFHNSYGRLYDVFDYEQSEQQGARLAANLCAYIRKSDAGTSLLDMQKQAEENRSGRRELEFESGMIFDNLLPGEEIGVIDSKRPNTDAAVWRTVLVRAACAAIGANASNVLREFSGSYSAQRQELVTGWRVMERHRQNYHASWLERVYRTLVAVGVIGGFVSMPPTATLDSFSRVILTGPGMPWVDLQKEVTSVERELALGLQSLPGAQRARGRNPRELAMELAQPGPALRAPAPPTQLELIEGGQDG